MLRGARGTRSLTILGLGGNGMQSEEMGVLSSGQFIDLGEVYEHYQSFADTFS